MGPTESPDPFFNGIPETAPATVPVLEPVLRRSSNDRSARVKLFILFAKSVPLIMAVGGGYLLFSYYFGGIPELDALVRKSSAMVGLKLEEPPAQTRAKALQQKTQAIVQAGNQRTNFANDLADDTKVITMVPEPVAEVPKAKLAPDANVTVASETKTGNIDALKSAAADLLDSVVAKVSLADPPLEIPATVRAEPEFVETVKVAQPSPAFRAWVDKAVISGVRKGLQPRIVINGLPVKPGDIIYRPMKIMIIQVVPYDSILVFRDVTGATLEKRY